jgi:copper chaperone CopZ
VRSALLAVKGVSRVKVTLEGNEAVVTYDSRQASAQDLIAAVNNAEAPFPTTYSAAVKPPAR